MELDGSWLKVRFDIERYYQIIRVLRDNYKYSHVLLTGLRAVSHRYGPGSYPAKMNFIHKSYNIYSNDGEKNRFDVCAAMIEVVQKWRWVLGKDLLNVLLMVNGWSYKL